MILEHFQGKAKEGEMKRSILAVVTGIVTIGVLAVGGDTVIRQILPGAFEANGFTANTGILVVMLFYSAIFSAVGGWLTARLSRRLDLRDIWILAGIQMVAGLGANAALYDQRLLWFYAAAFVLTPAAIIAGGRIHLARRPQPQMQSASI
jgi:ABC-type multidrug transport system fused ATPase/permease subunit